mmetsp:Transcript_7070/g.10512  ORF Transcript_7070/g.10512 Transcript_7070/m.10512 type:complete len:348 (-) Transcript_7070:207-1250(-)
MGASQSVLNSWLETADPALLQVVDNSVAKGCDVFLNDRQARNVFVRYIKKGEWQSQLGTTASLLSKNDYSEEITANIYSNFIFSSSIPAISTEIISRAQGNQSPDKKSGQDDAKIKVKNILLAAIFPLFLRSSDYTNWLDMKSSVSNVIISLPPERTVDYSTREDRLDDLFNEAIPLNTRDIVAEAASSVDEEEIESLLSAGQWLGNLLASVENLSLCVSLATARSDRRGFPLIYVNKAFEETTGYSRSEIVGQNCRFLQSEYCEKDQIELMSTALATAQPVKVAITNRRKDGTDFFNLLSMKPVFDDKGVYSYVIGVQYDISQTDTHIQDIKLVDDLLSILPNILN